MDKPLPQGMTFQPFFSRHGFNGPSVSPRKRVTWEKRTARITDAHGRTIFEQKDVDVPSDWSQTALNIAAQKYFRGALGTPERETSIWHMVDRVSGTIAAWGLESGHLAKETAEVFQDELASLLLFQMASFNSPVWFNVGTTAAPQCSACFINSVEDSLSSILDLAKTEGMLFKGGSGTGTNVSSIRSSQERLSGGGTASGPVSFMRGLDAFAGAIKSGGKTRRAAKMVILDDGHPDLVEFINCKLVEERKAHALIDAGYDGSFNVPGGAYESVAFQNANHSVRLSDAFMRAYDRNDQWVLPYREPRKAREYMREIAHAAWACGDPGVQFSTTINQWHTCEESGAINASNPCSEFVFLDDTACNLASLNLRAFQDTDTGALSVVPFEKAVAILITAMEIIVSWSSYPTEKIARNSQKFRPLGLGYANLGAFLMAQGIAYDSKEGRAQAAAITSLMTAQAYWTSARLAAVMGPFPGYAENAVSMRRVIQKHVTAHKELERELRECEGLGTVLKAARNTWRLMDSHEDYGYRNAQVTVLAPTGTIAFVMDCDTTGIEPDIALVKYKHLVGGGTIKIVNTTVDTGLTALGYPRETRDQILQAIEATGSIESCARGDNPLLKEEHLPVFDCAFAAHDGGRSIHYRGHLRMMEAVQPFLSGAISKTVNLPATATVEDVESVFVEGWRMGLKAIAIYRDGCKRTQPLSTRKPAEEPASKREEVTTTTTSPSSVTNIADVVAEQKKDGPPAARRHALPETRHSRTHKFSVAGHKGYITTGLYPNGKIGELFIRMAKEGSTIGGLMDSFATAISIGLQHGVPLATFATRFKGTRFEPAGYTSHETIRIATSLMDYVFRWLETVEGESAPSLAPERPPLVDALPAHRAMLKWVADAPLCHECGTITVPNGSCHKCPNCGATSGCS